MWSPSQALRPERGSAAVFAAVQGEVGPADGGEGYVGLRRIGKLAEIMHKFPYVAA